MLLRRYVPYLGMMIVMVAAPQLRAGDELPPADKEKIESLIKTVENLKNAKFIRKGSEYDCGTAATFLRGKWNWKSSEIKTVQDFIRVCSAGGSGEGTPYFVRQDGKDTPAKDFFAAELARLEKP